MKLDVLGLFAACSYALDCVEAELVHVTNKHAKRVAYMSVCIAEQMGISGKPLQDLAACALLHDNALTQYIQEELHSDIAQAAVSQQFPNLGLHCSFGEKKSMSSHSIRTSVMSFFTTTKTPMAPVLFTKNGTKFLFLPGSYTYVISWMSCAVPKTLPPTPGSKQIIFS